MITGLRRELPRLHDDPVAIPPGMITDSRMAARVRRTSGCDPSRDDHGPGAPLVQPGHRGEHVALPPGMITDQLPLSPADRQVSLAIPPGMITAPASRPRP